MTGIADHRVDRAAALLEVALELRAAHAHVLRERERAIALGRRLRRRHTAWLGVPIIIGRRIACCDITHRVPQLPMECAVRRR